MNTKTTLILAAVVILIAATFIVTRADEVPFRGCGEDCHSSPVFDLVTLSPLTGELDVLAIRLLPDGTVALGEESGDVFLNIFADYNGDGAYNADSTDERLAVDVRVDPLVETDHVFVFPSAQEYALNKEKFAVTVTASLLPLNEAVAEGAEGDEEPSVSMSHFLFNTNETEPVTGTFETIERGEAREGNMQQVAVPDVCIDQMGNQIPCGDEEVVSATDPDPLFYFFNQSDTDELLEKIVGPTSASTVELSEETMFFFSETPEEQLKRLLEVFEIYTPTNEFGGPFEAPADDTGSVLQYLTEAIVIS